MPGFARRTRALPGCCRIKWSDAAGFAGRIPCESLVGCYAIAGRMRPEYAARAKNADNTFLPGGHLEFYEDLKRALYREIMEETGISCTVDQYIGCVEKQWTESNINNHEINHVFLVNGINRNMEIKSKEEHLDIYWINLNNMEKENLLPYSMRTIIEKILSNNNSIEYISEIT